MAKKKISKKWIASIFSFVSIIFILLIAMTFRSCSCAVKERKTSIRIGRDPRWEPLNLMGKQRSMAAFSSELLSMIAKDKKLKIYFIDVRSSELFEGLDRGDYDAIMTSIEPNPILITLYNMSYPFYLTGAVIVVPINSKINSFEDLAGKSVGVKSGSSLVFHIREHPTILFRTYRNIRQALDFLIDDQIDAVLMDALPAYASISSFYQGKLKIVGKPLSDNGLRIIAKKNPQSEVFISRFNEGLKETLENGSYNELAEKWDLFNTLNSNKF